MLIISKILMIIHIIGLIFAAGSATIKLILLFKCRSDPEFYATYFQVALPVTRVLVFGMILLTVSGIAWMIIGYTFDPLLIFKMALVGIMWILGPVINNVAEPKFRNMVSQPEQFMSAKFKNAKKQYYTLEIIATALMYTIAIIGLYL